MGLKTKFNIALCLVMALAMGATGYISYRMLQDHARQEILHTAGIMMESAMAIRAYTVSEVRPLLAVQSKRNFLPQTVPAYAAMRNIVGLRKRYPEYTYKEATLNPTNPADRATDWEASVVEHFRNNPGSDELVGERLGAAGPSLYLSRPIQVNDASCLVCHGAVEDAPKTMVAQYGTANGFGWSRGEIVGAQIVNVPMAISLERAQSAFQTFMLLIAGVFAALALTLNILLHRIVVRPVTKMSSIAHDVSMGNLDAPEFETNGKDEIASLAESFNRMRRSLVNAMNLLEK